MRFTLAIITVAALTACGSDDPAGPADGATGTWDYTATLQLQADVVCVVEAELDLVQAAVNLSGSVDGTTTCNEEEASPFSLSVGGSAVGDSVVFTFDNDAIRRGTRTGGAMSGIVETARVSGTQIGAWSATRR